MRDLVPTSGSLTFTVDDANDTLDRTETVDVTDEGLPMRCVPRLYAAVSPGADQRDVEIPIDLSFDCYYEPGLRLILRVRALPDPRRWQEGEFEVALDGDGVEVTHGYGGQGRGPSTYCTAHVDDVHLHIVVDEARGTSRPHPELVEPAFVRRFTLELEVPSVRGEPQGTGRRPCPSVGVSVRASYLLDAESFRNESAGPRP